MTMSLEGHFYSISNLNMITNDILSSDVTLCDKEINEKNTNICTNALLTKYDRSYQL